MNIALPKSELQQGLGRVQAIVERRNSMPILANVLLSGTEDNHLEIIATDLEVGLRSLHSADVKTAGSVTVSARKLFEIIRELPDETVTLNGQDNGYLEIRCARSRFVLTGTAAEEYPSLPELSPGEMARLQAAVLSAMIERTIYAASTDETRYNLNGVFFEITEKDEKLRMVATDGHRLAMVDRLMAEGAKGLASGVILPRKALGELKRLVDEEDADEIDLGFEGSHALVRRGDVTLVMRLIDGEFPNYNQVVPKASPRKLILPAEDFGHVVRRVSLLSAERSRAIRVELTSGTLTVSSNNPDLGEAREELDVDYEGEGLSVGFNARYLLDVLASFRSKEIEISFDDELSPVVLRPTEDPDSTAVVMPMRL